MYTCTTAHYATNMGLTVSDQIQIDGSVLEIRMEWVQYPVSYLYIIGALCIILYSLSQYIIYL